MAKSTNILIFMFMFIAFGCTNHTKRNTQIMEDEFKKSLTDKAFQSNSKLEIFELKSLGYDSVNENHLDTLKIIQASNQFSKFQELSNINLDLSNSHIKMANIYLSLGDNTLTDMYIEDAQKDAKKAKEYRDSMAKYIKIDSLIRRRILSRKNPELIFRSKYFLKATLTKDLKNENILDTVLTYFNKNLKIISL